MHTPRITFLLISFIWCVGAAQDPTIEGRVIDAESRQPIPYAHVFISNTTIVAVTDEAGKFRLNGLIAARGELVVSSIGYETFSLQLVPERKQGKLEVRLKPRLESLESVVTVASTEDKEWQRNLKTFKKDFLGKTSNAKACELLNPWVLEFEKKGNTFIADATAPVEIMNDALGYELTFYLNTFQSSATEYSIVGPVRMRELDDPSRIEEWEKKREAAYTGSVKHFLHLLWKNEYRENAFRMYRSVNALEDEQRTGRFQADLGKRVKEVKREDVVRDDPKEGLVLFSLKPLEIHYSAARDYEPIYQDILHQVSWLQASGGIIRFDSAGNILNPEDVVVAGYWNRLRVSDLLPLNYEPGNGLREINEPERLLITTDKGTYADGSSIFYSVHTSGHSVTTYVDLLRTNGQVLATRIDPVEGGRASGFFKMPESDGPFYIRAATPKTMAAGGAFVKPVMKENADALLTCKAESDILKWKLDSLAGHEMLAFALQDIDGDTLSGNYSLSIIRPGSDCDCLSGSWTTFAAIPADNVVIGGVPSGRVTDKKGAGRSGKLILFTSDLSLSLERNIGNDGKFRLEDVVHYDTTQWMVQLYDRKNKPVEDFEIRWDDVVKPELPTLKPDMPDCQFVPKHAEHVVVGPRRNRSIPYVVSDSTRVLDEVTVRGRKVARDAKPHTTFRSYGTPQYVVTGEELMNNPAGVNVLNALNGRVPGLIISDVGTAWTGETIRIQIRGQSTFAKQEPPLIIVDGLPFDELDQAYSMLQTIPLSDIDRVEVRTALSPMMGTRGSNGVIAVYTKRSNRTVGTDTRLNAFVKSVTIKGYSPPARFQKDSLDMTTLFWAPSVEFSWRPVMIETADMSDDVEVVVSGVDPSGKFFTVRRRLDLRAGRAQLGSTSN